MARTTFRVWSLACLTGYGLLVQTAAAQTESPVDMPNLLVEDLLWEWHAQQTALEQLRTGLGEPRPSLLPSLNPLRTP